MARMMNRRDSIYLIIATFVIAAIPPLTVEAQDGLGEGARLLPSLKDIQHLVPGWFDEVRSEGMDRGSTYRVFRGWREVKGSPKGEKARVLLNITLRPRPDPSSPWGPALWRQDFEKKQALLERIPDLQAKEIDIGAFAYLVTRSGGSHVEVTFYAEDWMVTVHNGTDEQRLSYPAEDQALKIARWLASRLPQESPKN